ncbi:MAG: hypothetical protein QM733_15925 [Ilumatobacteraceae bacterium]
MDVADAGPDHLGEPGAAHERGGAGGHDHGHRPVRITCQEAQRRAVEVVEVDVGDQHHVRGERVDVDMAAQVGDAPGEGRGR